jgi:hypothetical protein
MKPITGAFARAFAFACLFALSLFLFAMPAHAAILAQASPPLPSGLQGWLLIAFTAASGLVWFASLLAHYIAPTSKFGKLVSFVAMNGGKALAEINKSGLIEKPPPPTGFARLSLLLALVALAIGCGFMRKEFGPTIAVDEEQCALAGAADVKAAAANILLTGGADYQAQLIALGVQVGKDTAICAVRVAIADFAAQHAAEAASDAGAAAPDEHTAAIARGQAYLASAATDAGQ